MRIRPATGVALSDAIGGGLLEEVLYGRVTTIGDAEGYCVYLDEDRVAKRLPLNDRAAALGARLGWSPRHVVVLRGDVLVTGATACGRDTDVPLGVLVAAARCLLLQLNSGATSGAVPGDR